MGLQTIVKKPSVQSCSNTSSLSRWFSCSRKETDLRVGGVSTTEFHPVMHAYELEKLRACEFIKNSTYVHDDELTSDTSAEESLTHLCGTILNSGTPDRH